MAPVPIVYQAIFLLRSGQAFAVNTNEGTARRIGAAWLTGFGKDKSSTVVVKGPEYDTDEGGEGGNEDEDLVEFTHNEETLLKGEKSGKIFRSTAEAGDVQIGVAGQGQFKDVKV